MKSFYVNLISEEFLVADVAEPESQLNAYEFLDVAIQPKPIFISPNEVYSMHRLLVQQSQTVVRPLCVVIRLSN